MLAEMCSITRPCYQATFKYLSSPAASVPCERLFSISGHVVNKKRASLPPDNINRLVCLSNWINMINYGLTKMVKLTIKPLKTISKLLLRQLFQK